MYFNTFYCIFILQNYFEFLKTKFENIDDLSQVVLQSKRLGEVVHLTRLLRSHMFASSVRGEVQHLLEKQQDYDHKTNRLNQKKGGAITALILLNTLI